MTGARRSSGRWAGRAAMMATSSASACSTAVGRRTWTAASTPRRGSGVWLGRRWGTAAHIVFVSPHEVRE
eukprot:14491627-Alexandrium_andersonii.AAC.1